MGVLATVSPLTFTPRGCDGVALPRRHIVEDIPGRPPFESRYGNKVDGFDVPDAPSNEVKVILKGRCSSGAEVRRFLEGSRTSGQLDTRIRLAGKNPYLTCRINPRYYSRNTTEFFMMMMRGHHFKAEDAEKPSTLVVSPAPLSFSQQHERHDVAEHVSGSSFGALERLPPELQLLEFACGRVFVFRHGISTQAWISTVF